MREPVASTLWTEIILNDAAVTCTLHEAVAEGHSILIVHELATPAECAALLSAACAKAEAVHAGQTSSQNPGKLSTSLALRLEHSTAPMTSPGRVRMPLACLGSAAQASCDCLLLRTLDLLEAHAPALDRELFGETSLAAMLRQSDQPIFSSSSLAFTHNEPAINLYTAGGSFEPHKDLQTLTLLMPLTDGECFQGGGTAFWSRTAADPVAAGLGTISRDVSTTAPATTLTPPAGSALLFGGDVTHAGQAVTAGQRAVFVASFSRRRAESQETGRKDVGEEELRRLERTMLSQIYGASVQPEP